MIECGSCRTYFEQLHLTREMLLLLPRGGGTSPKRAELIEKFKDVFDQRAADEFGATPRYSVAPQQRLQASALELSGLLGGENCGSAGFVRSCRGRSLRPEVTALRLGD